MKRKPVALLICCLVIGSATVVALYALNNHNIHEPNSFMRNYIPYAAVKANEIDLKLNSYYIAGITEDNIFFANLTNPFILLVGNRTLTDTSRIHLRVKNADHLKFHQAATVAVDPPHFYIADGMQPGIFRGKLGEWEAEYFMGDSVSFSAMVPISKNSFAIRNTYWNKDNIEYKLGKMLQKNSKTDFQKGLLQKQVDGFFCCDGSLSYNKDLNRIIYTYYYRNQYIVYDTSLNLDFRGHTIDTFSRAQIKVDYNRSEKSKSLTSNKTINLTSCTSGKYLFIHSNLVAKNDIPTILETYSIIDVYDLSDHNYKFSMMLGNYSKKDRIKNFQVFNNKILVALFDHHVVLYDLKSDLLL